MARVCLSDIVTVRPVTRVPQGGHWLFAGTRAFPRRAGAGAGPAVIARGEGGRRVTTPGRESAQSRFSTRCDATGHDGMRRGEGEDGEGTAGGMPQGRAGDSRMQYGIPLNGTGPSAEELREDELTRTRGRGRWTLSRRGGSKE